MTIRIVYALLILAAFGSQAHSKCRPSLPSADWRNAPFVWYHNMGQLGLHGIIRECKTAKCGGPKKVVLYSDKKIDVWKGGQAELDRLSSGPLRFDGLKGKASTYPNYRMEAYVGPHRQVIMIASGKTSSIREKNLATLKSSLRCN